MDRTKQRIQTSDIDKTTGDALAPWVTLGFVDADADRDFVIETVPHADPKTIEKTIELGDRARDTLGLLPRAVYHDAAAKECLLAARHTPTGEVIGYVLFRLPRDEVVLTHVCVDPTFRERGVATSLVTSRARRANFTRSL